MRGKVLVVQNRTTFSSSKSARQYQVIFQQSACNASSFSLKFLQNEGMVWVCFSSHARGLQKVSPTCARGQRSRAPVAVFGIVGRFSSIIIAM